MNSITRRRFLQSAVVAPVGLAATSEQPLRLGVVGAGRRGLELIRLALELPWVRITKVGDLWDPNLNAVRSLGVRSQMTPMYEKVLRSNVDAAVVAVPDHLKLTIVSRALEYNLDVFVEPPLAFSATDLQALQSMANKRDRLLEVGYQYASLSQEPLKPIGNPARKGDRVVIRGFASGYYGGFNRILKEATLEDRRWSWFLGRLPHRPFEPAQFFQWNRYSDFSHGPATHGLAHLLSVVVATIPDSSLDVTATAFQQDTSGLPNAVAMRLEDQPWLTVELFCRTNPVDSIPRFSIWNKGAARLNTALPFWRSQDDSDPDRGKLSAQLHRFLAEPIPGPVEPAESQKIEEWTRSVLHGFLRRSRVRERSNASLDLARKVESVALKVPG